MAEVFINMKALFSKYLFLIFVQLTMGSAFASPKELPLPNAQKRKAMVLNLSQEILRLDGEGLIPRVNRPESWESTMQRLAEEASEAKSLYELGLVFKRVDATYPNLHAKIVMIPELDERKTEGTVVFPISFFPVSAERKFTSSKFKINTRKDSKSDFQSGDELLSINSRPLQEWTDENFIFCKFPYREQCEIEFYDNFRKELSGWNRHQPLELKVRRGSEELTFAVHPEVKPWSQDEEPTNLPCDVQPNRYKGFKLAYEGENLCAFESVQNPNVVALRIKSFVYQDVPFAVLDGEVQIFWNNYWSKKSPKVKTLILDVIDNHGGQSPVPYYGLFYSQPYQEQYVQFKKIAEFERQDILESLFWGDKGKEIWFDSIKKDGTFSRAKNGDFFGQIPQFCANRKKDCREDLFQPRANGFKGQVKVLMNQWCVSSCVGFVSNIKDLLKERVKTYGIPDSGDSAYSRLTVFVSPEAEAAVGAMKKAQKPDEPAPWIRQIVSVTRSTDKDGKILSGIPQAIDVWVPRIWNQSDDEWASSVFNKAVGR
jgi:hypothetical protein